MKPHCVRGKNAFYAPPEPTVAKRNTAFMPYQKNVRPPRKWCVKCKRRTFRVDGAELCPRCDPTWTKTWTHEIPEEAQKPKPCDICAAPRVKHSPSGRCPACTSLIHSARKSPVLVRQGEEAILEHVRKQRIALGNSKWCVLCAGLPWRVVGMCCRGCGLPYREERPVERAPVIGSSMKGCGSW